MKDEPSRGLEHHVAYAKNSALIDYRYANYDVEAVRAAAEAAADELARAQTALDRVNNTDTFEVLVEMTPEMFTDSVGEIQQLQKTLSLGLNSMLGIRPKVTLVAPKTIARSEGKAVRVIDKRKI